MEPNPYEAPRTEVKGRTSEVRSGVRLMTVAVFAMLTVLVLMCAVLGVVAYCLQGLG